MSITYDIYTDYRIMNREIVYYSGIYRTYEESATVYFDNFNTGVEKDIKKGVIEALINEYLSISKFISVTPFNSEIDVINEIEANVDVINSSITKTQKNIYFECNSKNINFIKNNYWDDSKAKWFSMALYTNSKVDSVVLGLHHGGNENHFNFSGNITDDTVREIFTENGVLFDKRIK